MGQDGVTFEELAEEENSLLRKNVARFPQQYAFANNAVSILSTGVTGYVTSRRAFGFYLSQISVNLCLATVSALRQHKVQVYANLRQAVEHTSLAAYALHHPDTSTYFSSDPEQPINHEKLRKKVYTWLSATYPRESKHLIDIKQDINRDYSHADIDHARRNLDIGGVGVVQHQASFTDIFDASSIRGDLIHVGHTALVAFTALLEADLSLNVLRLRSGIRGEVAQVMVMGQVAMQEAKAAGS